MVSVYGEHPSSHVYHIHVYTYKTSLKADDKDVGGGGIFEFAIELSKE